MASTVVHAATHSSVMDFGGSQQGEARMMLLGVVPGERVMAVGSHVLDRPDAFGETPPTIFSVFELGLREWVVVGTRAGGHRSWSRPGGQEGATGFGVIAEPRSAWIVNWLRSMPWRAHMSWCHG